MIIYNYKSINGFLIMNGLPLESFFEHIFVWIINHLVYIVSVLFIISLVYIFKLKNQEKQNEHSSSTMGVESYSSTIEYIKADEIPLANMRSSRPKRIIEESTNKITIKNPPHSNVKMVTKMPPFDKNKHIVLVIDDQQVMLEKIASKLKDKYNLIFAKSVNEAIRKIEYMRPAVVVSDIDMDEKSGIDLVIFLKNTAQYANLPVILMTANMDYYYKDLLKLGVKGYLAKPFEMRLLEEQINYLINQN
jgi:histidine kinase